MQLLACPPLWRLPAAQRNAHALTAYSRLGICPFYLDNTFMTHKTWNEYT
jgi:hypothetical protein